MRKNFILCAVGALTLAGALALGHLTVWASQPVSSDELNNVEALNDDTFSINCGSNVSLCKVMCTSCGAEYENTTGGQTLKVSGSCIICGGTTFVYMK